MPYAVPCLLAAQNQYAIKMVDYSYINGRLRCDFTRLIITNNTAQDRHLNEDWYILLAYSDEKGSTASDPFVAVDLTNVEMMQHTSTILTSRTVCRCIHVYACRWYSFLMNLSSNVGVPHQRS